MKHLRLKLYDNPDEGPQPQRPELSVWFDDIDPDGLGQTVTVAVSAAWGTQQRFIAMTPDEAKAFARLLLKTANEASASELVQLVEP